MTKDLVLFWGWSRGERSYAGLKKSAPDNWRIFVVSHEELMPLGDIPRLNQSILKFLADHNLKKAAFCGHSLGGAIALEFAFHHPEVVEHLYLADSEGVYEPNHPLQLLFNAIHPGPGSRRNPLEDIRSLARVVRRPVLNARLAHHAHNVNLLSEAGGLRVPTTIIWGEKDRLTPLGQGEKLHQLIADSRLVVLPGLGHDWIMHNPELFWQNVDSGLRPG